MLAASNSKDNHNNISTCNHTNADRRSPDERSSRGSALRAARTGTPARLPPAPSRPEVEIKIWAVESQGFIAMHVCVCLYLYIYIYGTPPPQRPRFSYINIQSGRWGSQSEIDGMGLRVGGFGV